MTEILTTASQLPEMEHAAWCIRCGYDLRGLGAAGRCPECGLDVFWSLRAPQQLAQYPAPWVSSMSWGAQMLALAYGIGFAVLILGITGYLPANGDLNLATFAALTMLHAIGAWMLSRRSGHYTEAAAPFNRFFLRAAPLAFAAGAVGLLPVYHGLVPQRWQWFVFGATCAGAVAPVPIFVRLRAVARMIADEGLAEHSVIVAWGFFATVLALGALSLSEAMRNSTGNALLMLTIVMLIATAALLFILWGAFIMLCCVIDFGRAAKVARAEWKASEARE